MKARAKISDTRRFYKYSYIWSLIFKTYKWLLKIIDRSYYDDDNNDDNSAQVKWSKDEKHFKKRVKQYVKFGV